MDQIKNAELFAKEKLSGIVRNDGRIPYSKHLDDVMNRLKSLGVIDDEILCAGWLHDVMEHTSVNFDDLYGRFGSRVAIMVSDLTPDVELTKKKRDQAYVLQLKHSSPESKIIMLCDISANLSDLKNYDVSKSKKLRLVRQQRRYLSAINLELSSNTCYPLILILLTSVENSLNKFARDRVKPNQRVDVRGKIARIN